MHLQAFLRENVENYLLADIRTMLATTAPRWDRGGGLGYPLISTVFSGIELLGELTWPSRRPKGGSGKKAFQSYWSSYLYPARQHAPAEARRLYELMRNPIAHTFMLRANLAITYNTPGYHLHRDRTGILHLDAHQLANDFLSSYDHQFLPLLSTRRGPISRTSIEARAREIAASLSGHHFPDSFEHTHLSPLPRAGGMESSPPVVPSEGGSTVVTTAASSSASLLHWGTIQ